MTATDTGGRVLLLGRVHRCPTPWTPHDPRGGRSRDLLTSLPDVINPHRGRVSPGMNGMGGLGWVR